MPTCGASVPHIIGGGLPQVSFFSRQKGCRDKHVFVGTKYVFCRDKSMLVTTNIFLSLKKSHEKQNCDKTYIFFAIKVFLSRQTRQTFVATNMCLSPKNYFVATNTILSRQAFFVATKEVFLSGQTRVCRDKTFVARKIILVAATHQ